MKTEIETYLKSNINLFSNFPITVTKVTDLTDNLADDPGNEYIFIATLQPENEDNDISDLDISTRKMNNHLQSEPFCQGDHAVTIENVTLLNSTALLMITALK